MAEKKGSMKGRLNERLRVKAPKIGGFGISAKKDLKNFAPSIGNMKCRVTFAPAFGISDDRKNIFSKMFGGLKKETVSLRPDFKRCNK